MNCIIYQIVHLGPSKTNTHLILLDEFERQVIELLEIIAGVRDLPGLEAEPSHRLQN